MIPAGHEPAFHLEFSATGDVRVSGHGALFTRECQYELDGEVVERELSGCFAGALADAVELALAVYTADRLCPRRPRRANRYDHYWQRRISVRVPVRSVDFWSQPSLRELLTNLLAFMTEDHWELEFVERASLGRSVQGQLFDRRPSPPVTACLFSGGLDSLAGLAQDLIERPSDTFVLVSGYTNHRLAKVQHLLASALSDRFPDRVRLLQVPFGIRRDSHTYDDEESTQRSRGFIHCLIGSAVAIVARAETLLCYENGIGALNLPLTDAQLGAQNARSSHPIALETIGALMRRVSGQDFEIRLPRLYQTKGEICRALVRPEFSDLIRHTVSCDGYPRRVRGFAQCGSCTSCVLRRQALKVAGLLELDPASLYQHDLHDGQRWKGEEVTFGMSAMLHQVRRMERALASTDPWRRLATAFPALEETVCRLAHMGRNEEETRQGMLRLYRQYCSDWDRFAQESFPFAA